MGICQSCLYGESDIVDENEQTALLREPQPVYYTVKDPDPRDRKKHEQLLNSIVNFTGRNLIDVTSVGVEEVASSGKSAGEYQQALDTFQNYPLEEPLSKFDKNLSLKLSTSQVDWLNKLAKEAEEAVLGGPRVAAVGELVQTFG